MQIYTLHADGIFDHTDFVSWLIVILRESTLDNVLSVFDVDETFTISTLLNDLITETSESDTKECMLVALISQKLRAYEPICKKCLHPELCETDMKSCDDPKDYYCDDPKDCDSSFVPEITIQDSDDEVIEIPDVKIEEKKDDEPIKMD